MERNCVLIVDDDVPIIHLLELVLSRYGFRVTVAQDGEQALERFKTEAPDAVLLDLNLPKKPGWEVYKQMKAQRNIPIILTTGNIILGDHIKSAMAPNDSYVAKPFDILSLAARFQAMLEN